jgi:hypothetical protein
VAPQTPTTTSNRDELLWLQRAAQQGVWVAPMVVVAAHIEDDFYRWNNLQEPIQQTLAPFNEADPDEDDIAEVTDRLQRLVLEHALLDAVVDHFYQEAMTLPARLRVRRPGEAGVMALRGRPALLAVKRTWAEAWTLEAIMARTRAQLGWWPEAQPVLLHADDAFEDATLAAAAGEALGERVRAWRDSQGRLLRLAREPNAD